MFIWLCSVCFEEKEITDRPDPSFSLNDPQEEETVSYSEGGTVKTFLVASWKKKNRGHSYRLLPISQNCWSNKEKPHKLRA